MFLPYRLSPLESPPARSDPATGVFGHPKQIGVPGAVQAELGVALDLEPKFHGLLDCAPVRRIDPGGDAFRRTEKSDKNGMYQAVVKTRGVAYRDREVRVEPRFK